MASSDSFSDGSLMEAQIASASRRPKEEAPDAVMTLEDFLMARTGGGDDVKEEPIPMRKQESAAERAAMQRQRRMIKNRESAARSRERKQAYQVELETIAQRLDDERRRLLDLKAQRSNRRLKQILQNVIPVEEKRRPRRILRRVRSFEW